LPQHRTDSVRSQIVGAESGASECITEWCFRVAPATTAEPHASAGITPACRRTPLKLS
jgi:hypothetical protein